uniref:Neur_chan_LBD domain-containing protein n=1 Tax=Panagrellus redivivus TaxID=6233 RepID=A0A7E4VN77_PANRE
MSANDNLKDRLQKNARRPPWSSEYAKPLDVKIGIYVESLGKFQSTEMSFDVDLYLYMSWNDYTLNHTEPEYILVNDPKVREQIWLPDLYFANARTAFFHDVTVPNFNLFIAQDGTIAYSSRVTLTVACNLMLSHYPMDHQVCQIKILSYAYIANQVNVTWFSREPIRYNPEIGLPEFIIQNIDKSYCDGTYMYAIMQGSHRIDKFSCLEALIFLRRAVGYHVVQSYIPTALIVIISWVSFWIDRRAVPARVTLSFTTLLSLSTLGNGLRFGLPMVSYAKALDYYYGMSIESDDDEMGPYIPSNIKKHSYHLLGGRTSAKPTEKASSFSSSKMPMFSAFRAKSALSRSISPLNENGNGCKMSNGSTTARAPTVPTAEVDIDASTMHLDTTFQGSVGVDLNTCKLIDESSTKTSVSDEEWPEPMIAITPSLYHSQRTEKRPPPRGRRDNTTIGVNHFVQLGFLNSRKALEIDKKSRILFPLSFAIFNLLYWVYYLYYIPATSTTYTGFDPNMS